MPSKITLTSLFVLISLSFLSAQTESNTKTKLKFANRFIIGSSLNYIRNKNTNNSFDLNLKHREFTWNKDVAVNLTSSIYLGFSHRNIYTSGSTVVPQSTKNSFQMTGIFTQYDFLPKEKSRLFAELSLNYGNYCTCGINGINDPFKEPDLYYLGWGGGFDYPITNILSIDLSFISHHILNDILRKYAYTQYVIGLNLDIIKK